MELGAGEAEDALGVVGDGEGLPLEDFIELELEAQELLVGPAALLEDAVAHPRHRRVQHLDEPG